jgi:hypothetical protein
MNAGVSVICLSLRGQGSAGRAPIPDLCQEERQLATALDKTHPRLAELYGRIVA